MALKGSTHKLSPFRNRKIEETRSKVSETLQNGENKVVPYRQQKCNEARANVTEMLSSGEKSDRTCDIFAVSDQNSICMNTKGLADITRTTENPDKTTLRHMIAVLAIGIILFLTLVAIIAGIIGYHVGESGDAEAVKNATSKNEWNTYTKSVNNNSYESLEHLISTIRAMLQLANNSQIITQNKSSKNEYCQQHHNSHLVEVETEAENLFLMNYLRGLKGPWGLWLGITDEHTERVWRWATTDSDASYTGWHPSEPQNGTYEEDCAVFYIFHNYQWADVGCESEFDPICEL